MKKGDRVVCIDDTLYKGIHDNMPVKDHVYILVSIHTNPYGEATLFLEGVYNGSEFGEPGWHGFNAINYRKIDDESFTNELTKELANEAQKDEFNKLERVKEKEAV